MAIDSIDDHLRKATLLRAGKSVKDACTFRALRGLMRPAVASDPPTVIFYTAIVGLSWLRPRAADREREWRERQLEQPDGSGQWQTGKNFRPCHPPPKPRNAPP